MAVSAQLLEVSTHLLAVSTQLLITFIQYLIVSTQLLTVSIYLIIKGCNIAKVITKLKVPPFLAIFLLFQNACVGSLNQR